jgi:2-iminoacetate synthase
MAATAQHIDIRQVLAERGLDGCGRDIWTKRLEEIKSFEVEWALSRKPGYYVLDRLLIFISPAAENYLEQMAQIAHQLTLRRFGKTVRLYAPMYLSKQLSIEQALAEADIIAKDGFKDLLLLSSEDKDFITVDYLAELASKLRPKFSSLSVEIYQISAEEYAKLFAASIEGVTLYQETYDRNTYRKYHTEVPNADYDFRLSAPDSFGQAGMREIGLGVLLGLDDWRLETLALAEHAHYLMKKYWKSRVSFSFPRLRPAKDADLTPNTSHGFQLLSDKNLVQMILALRLCFADAGMTISEHEPAHLRDQLVKLGITRMSAGSKTNPGGYSVEKDSVGQFDIDDSRSPAQVATMLKSQGLEPVWKDWDSAFTSD